jgi:restriction system protein
MRRSERNPAVEIVRVALGLVWLPFAWAAAAPAAALRRYRASSAQPRPSAERAGFDTRKWTPELLKRLEWRRFEELCAAYYEALGFRARLTHSRADGGVDISLYAEASESASTIVHCKAWDAYRVGVNPLEALRRAMAASRVRKGVLVTSGRFTREAVSFAAQENIQLIDGAGLLGKLAELEPEKSLALLQFTTQGDFLTPTCPCCSIKMISRRSIKGGRKFWGCLNYPRCKQTFPGTA